MAKPLVIDTTLWEELVRAVEYIDDNYLQLPCMLQYQTQLTKCRTSPHRTYLDCNTRLREQTILDSDFSWNWWTHVLRTIGQQISPVYNRQGIHFTRHMPCYGTLVLCAETGKVYDTLQPKAPYRLCSGIMDTELRATNSQNV